MSSKITDDFTIRSRITGGSEADNLRFSILNERQLKRLETHIKLHIILSYHDEPFENFSLLWQDDGRIELFCDECNRVVKDISKNPAEELDLED